MNFVNIIIDDNIFKFYKSSNFRIKSDIPKFREDDNGSSGDNMGRHVCCDRLRSVWCRGWYSEVERGVLRRGHLSVGDDIHIR